MRPASRSAPRSTWARAVSAACPALLLLLGGGAALAQAPAEAEPSLLAAWALPAGLALFGIVALATAFKLWMAGRRSRMAGTIYPNVIKTLPHPRQVVDAQGRTLLANEAFYRFFGGSERPTPELLASEVDDEDMRAQLERLMNEVRNGRSGHAEVAVRMRPRDAGLGDDWPAGVDARGQEALQWCYVAGHPVAGHPGAVFWMVDDITLRRQMEQVMREEQAHFVELLDHAPIGFYSVDGEGRFVFVNETLAEWLGSRPGAMISNGVHLHEILASPPEHGVPYNPFDEPDEERGDVLLTSSGGKRFEVFIAQDLVRDADGRVLRTRSVVRHLSNERAMAIALAQSEQRFQRFFEEAPIGIALLDSIGVITEYNNAMRELVASEGELKPGTSLLDLIEEQDRAAVRAGLERAAREESWGKPGVPIDVRLAGKTDRVCALFVNSLDDGPESAGGFMAHFIDTTEQKTLEAQFAQSQKMQAVGQLAGGIAHDFNNLLTAMIGFSDLLLLRHRPGDQSFADVMQIKQNANRAANLVRQLLAFSRQQTLQPRVLDITNILAELTHLLRRLIGETIELKLIHGRDLGRIRADQGQLEQVIINLAVNARDAMPEGGQLTVVTENVQLDHEVKAKGETMPPGHYTRIQVSDTGCGIPVENLDRIFEPFFSTKEVGAGTGLGLSTVYGIVKQTGGFIFVHSRLAEGTSFSIYLPHYVASAAEAAAAEAAGEESRDLTGAGTVLLVEDEDGVRAFSARALRNKGYEVIEARSGDAALEVLDGNTKPIDLLITDVVMPKIDGPTLVRQVRETRPDLKVIFISGYTEDTFRKRLDQEAGIHFLPKPFSLKQLAGKVKEVMREQEPV
ncbi:MAG: ATP-binding protein [Kiloniellales bacterium]